jgi:hemin uptake protein HemP
MLRTPQKPRTETPVGNASPGAGKVDSQSLLGPRGELLILHNGREYRLRRTQSGKLILTA